MFQSARIKLTAWYLLIIMVVSLTFSAGIFRILCLEVDRFEQAQRIRIERRLQEGNIMPQGFHIEMLPRQMLLSAELVEETKRRLLVSLALINSAVFIAAGGLGYILAGRTLKPIQHMVEEQNRFVSDASHEFRTPLTSLKTAMEVFLRAKKQTVADAKTLITENMVDVNKLQRLSDDLLILAKTQKPKDHGVSTLLSTDELVKSAIQEISHNAILKQIELHFATTSIDLWGNKDELTRVMVILLDNAIKYSKPNGKVSVQVDKDSHNVHIRIADEGIGIDEKDIPHIFDRFYRADTARSHNGNGGYGLGLSIAKKIVEAHKGIISVQSTLHKGSLFIISLPLYRERKGNV